jgi:hypothetical protein
LSRASAICLLLLLTVAAFYPGLSSGGAHGRVFFPQGQSTSNAAFRPGTLGVAGEGSFVVKYSKWRSWNQRAARGTGIGVQGYYNGPHFRGPVRIVLYRPRIICGKWFFSKAIFTFLRGKPDGIPRRWHWDLGQFPCGV